MTLIEVLIVVALLTIMLGIAVPNIIGAQRQLKLKELNENARAVAVAVQSKLYGMRNAGTSATSSYAILNENATFTAEIIPTSKTGEEKDPENVCYITNFVWADEELGDGETTGKEPITEEEKKERVDHGKSMLLSGALMDLELQKGKVAVFFKPETADVLEVFYSEKEYNITQIIELLEFNTLRQDYLDQREIGHYYGYGVEEPERLEGMPLFTCNWVWDDELRLQIKMLTEPSEELMKKKLGLEIYLQFPAIDESAGKKKEEMMIYAEGIFAEEYETTFVNGDFQKIQKDEPLTFQQIKENNNMLNFALDSMVTTKAGWGSMKKYLRHETEPKVTTTAESLLYPRDSLDFWTDCTQNPYITVWFRQHADSTTVCPYEGDPTMSQKLCSEFAKYAKNEVGHTPTNFVGVDERISVRVKLYVLEGENGEVKCDPDLTHSNSCVQYLRKADASINPVNIVSHSIDPYYYLLTSSGKEVALTSMRDFSNLRYIFQSTNKIEVARLHSDISGQQFFSKLLSVQKALTDKFGEDELNRPTDKGTVENDWPIGASRDGCAVDAMYINNKNKDDCEKGFTLSGKNSDGGNYKISNVAAGVENWDLGGYFGLAQNCTFENIDIVNSESWRNGYNRDLIKKESNKITGFDVDWSGGVTGTLVGIAVNCKFENVRVYIDPQNQLKDSSGNTATNISYNRLSGVLVGGLVGLAIGDKTNLADENDGKTTFSSCAASIITSPEVLYPAANCVYAGGLVGATLGNVDISNSYGASQVGGYYSGGLIGVTVAGGSFKYFYSGVVEGHDGQDVTVPDGQTKVENSFAAGIISRQTRVGGGLIADVNDSSSSDALSVSNCYSACWWEALPPVAYGTFQGDDKNYYVVQNKLTVPVGMTVEAAFSCTGDVFSLQDIGNKGGIGCATLKDLEKGLDIETPESIWTNPARTQRWAHAENQLLYTFATDETTIPEGGTKSPDYPFPMPVKNKSFWGDWIRYYDTTTETTGTGTTTGTSTNFSAEFKGFFVAYQASPWDTRYISLAGFQSVTNWQNGNPEGNKLEIKEGNTLSVNGKQFNPETGWETETHKENNQDTGKYYCFWCNFDGQTPMQGIDGVTKVTIADENKFHFEGPKFYNPNFDPIKGYEFKLEGTDINLGDTTINWDVLGFYCLADFMATATDMDYNNGGQQRKYYIKFETTGVTIPQGDDKAVKVKGDKNANYVYVHKDAFKSAIGYDEHTFSQEGVQLVWNSSHKCFEVLDKGEHLNEKGETVRE